MNMIYGDNLISEEDLAENLEEVLEEVELTGATLGIQRDGVTVARLVSYEEYQHTLEGWKEVDFDISDELYAMLRALAIAGETTIPNVIRAALEESLNLQHAANIAERDGEVCI